MLARRDGGDEQVVLVHEPGQRCQLRRLDGLTVRSDCAVARAHVLRVDLQRKAVGVGGCCVGSVRVSGVGVRTRTRAHASARVVGRGMVVHPGTTSPTQPNPTPPCPAVPYQFKRLVFPAPEAPMIANIWPGSTSPLTPERIRTFSLFSSSVWVGRVG